MKVIAIISEKGGAGKTTLAVNLAVAAEAHGLATVDFRPRPPRQLDRMGRRAGIENSRRCASPSRPACRSCSNRPAAMTPIL